MSLASYITNSAKWLALSSTLGLSSDETKLLDKWVGTVGTNPFVSGLMGRDVKSVSEAFEALGSVNGSETAFAKNMALKAISDPQGRQMLAKVMVSALPKDSEGNVKYDISAMLMKVANSPFGANVPSTFRDPEHLISEGILPILNEHFTPSEEPQAPHVVKCRYCKESFLI